MARWAVLLFATAAAASLVPSSSAQCSSLTFSDSRVYSLCKTLPYLGSSLHWTYHPSNITVDLAFRANLNPPAWIAWGINPSARRMIGTQALVAVVSASGNVSAYPSSITSYSPPVQRGNLSITVFHISAAYSAGVMTIFATISLPNNSTIVNHVWQTSYSLSGDAPVGHLTAGDHVLSKGTINLLYDESVSKPTYHHLKSVHAILCTVGWGIIHPIGFWILFFFASTNSSRVRVLNAIFLSSLVIGSVGWVLGLALGNESAGVEYSAHRGIGIAIFVLATWITLDFYFQMDGRCYISFNTLSVSILSIVNIFIGFHILGGPASLRTAYIVIISTIVALPIVGMILLFGLASFI